MNNMGVLYERKEDFVKAAEYYRKGLAIKEQTNAPIKAIMISAHNVARSLLQLKQIDEAIELMKNSFKRLEDFPDLFSDTRSLLWETMGTAHLALDNFREASVAFKKAIYLRTQTSPHDNSILGLVCLYAKSLLALSEYTRVVKEVQKGLCLCESIRKNTPTNPTIVFTYEKLMEANFALKRRDDLENTYAAGKDEFFRLIKVYEELNNFHKREDVLSHFQRFRARYLEMLKELNNEIPNEIDGVVLISLLGLKIVCITFLYLCMKSKEK